MSNTTKPTIQSNVILLAVSLLITCGVCTNAIAEESQAEIAKKLNDPIADLISVPF